MSQDRKPTDRKSKAEIVRGNYAYFLESGAPYVTERGVGRSFLDRYKGFVPDLLLELWQQQGLGLTHNGLLQFCDPEVHASVLGMILEGDPELRPDKSLAYAYSAFGRLFVWNTRWQTISIDLPRRWIHPRYVTTLPPEANSELSLASQLAIVSPDTYDVRDTAGKPLFERAVQKLGPLEFGEVYGFFPALGLGGAADLKYLRRVKAPEHFAILAQFGPFTVIDDVSPACNTYDWLMAFMHDDRDYFELEQKILQLLHNPFGTWRIWTCQQVFFAVLT